MLFGSRITWGGGRVIKSQISNLGETAAYQDEESKCWRNRQ